MPTGRIESNKGFPSCLLAGHILCKVVFPMLFIVACLFYFLLMTYHSWNSSAQFSGYLFLLGTCFREMHLLCIFAWALIFSGGNVSISWPHKKEMQLTPYKPKPKSLGGSVCAHAASGKPGSHPWLLPTQQSGFVLCLYLGLKEWTLKLPHPWVFSSIQK